MTLEVAIPITSVNTRVLSLVRLWYVVRIFRLFLQKNRLFLPSFQPHLQVLNCHKCRLSNLHSKSSHIRNHDPFSFIIQVIYVTPYLLSNYFWLSLESFIWLMWFMLIYDVLLCINILLSGFILLFSRICWN